MNRFDDEPLSPEERALADRLARLGPHDGPSPALDAKILAAAHAAAAPPQRRRGRWLGLAAIPGGLITGAGMAAALVLVIGTVWQLRPADPAPQPARSEGDAATVSAEIIERRQQVIAPPPPPPAAEAPAPARTLNPPRADRGASVAQRKMAPAEAPAISPDEASMGILSRPGTVGPDEQPLAFREVAADAPAADSFTAPAPAAAPPPPAQVQAYSDAQRSEAFEQARARQQRSDDQAVSAKRAAMAAVAAPAAAPPPAAAPETAPSDAGQQTTLDRIEVTGSRIRSGDLLADTPVSEDARLDPAAWLERVRERRDAGDLDDARESLALFRKAHPRVRLPDDLRALANPATPATKR